MSLLPVPPLPQLAAASVLTTSLASCGLAGLDAYGRPDPCPGKGQTVQLADGSFSCAYTPAEIVLTGTLSPNHPEVVARAAALAKETNQLVAYTDGKTTRTFAPPLTS